MTAAIPPIQSHYSMTVTDILKAMLQKDPKLRPTINNVLKHPAISRRIKYFLKQDIFMDEFSHTVMHNHDAFKHLAEQLSL